MTKYIHNLKILHRVVAVIHFLQGLFMTFGGRNIAEQYGWDYSIGFAAMVEHHGSTLICVSIYFWFLPSLLNLENLKRVSILGLIVQAILILMPIYHAVFGYFPIDPSFYIMIFVLTFIMILFFLASRDDSQNE
jgi:hypothetical protein